MNLRLRSPHLTPVALLLAALYLPAPRLAAATAAQAPIAPATGAADASPSDKAWAAAQRWYATNDFAQAETAITHVTSGPNKKDAQAMHGRIQAYVAALQDGTNAEIRKDLVAAIQAYAIAAQIKADGPGDPAGRIKRVQQQAAMVTAPKDDPNALKAKRDARHHAQAVQLVQRAQTAEAAGNLQAALDGYTAASTLDPTNTLARDAIARLKPRLQGSSQDTARISAAIRDVYAGHFPEAEQQLSPLSTVAGAPWHGAACFYLGVSRFYQLLQTEHGSENAAFNDPGVHAAFQQAKAGGYQPLPTFVSPTLMHLWQGLP